MKKAIFSLLLAGSLILTGCGDSNNDYNQISGQPGNPAPIVTPTPTSGYFVDTVAGDNATANPATGAPYKTISAAVSAAPVGTDIIVRPGTYAESITLKNNQRLLGSGSSRITAQSVQRPEINGSIILGDGNTVDFIKIKGSNGDAIDGDGQNGGTITDCEFSDTTNVGSGVQARAVTGTWVVENNKMSNLAGIGVDITAELGDQVVAYVNNNNIANSASCAIAFQAEDDGQIRAQTNGNVMTDNQLTATFEVIAGEQGTVTLQIIGNQNDDTYRFSLLDSPAAAINVENFGSLLALNNNTGTILVDLDPVTPISDAGF